MADASLHSGESLTLGLPLDSAYLTTARLFAAAAGRQLGLEEGTVEDLKLAISEACTRAISAGSAGDGEVRLSVTAVDGRVTFRLATDGSGDSSDAIGLQVIEAMFQGTRVEDTAGGGSTISFSIPLPAGSAA